MSVVNDMNATPVSDRLHIAIFGRRNAGKSTLIEAIAQGVPYTGQISLEGRDIRALKGAERARSVGFLAQKNAVSYAYSVEEVVSLGRYAHASGFLSARDDEGEARVERALEWTGLTALRRASGLTLSGGEPLLQAEFSAEGFSRCRRIRPSGGCSRGKGTDTCTCLRCRAGRCPQSRPHKRGVRLRHST